MPSASSSTQAVRWDELAPDHWLCWSCCSSSNAGLLDIGCGSGVLSVAAAKLGFGRSSPSTARRPRSGRSAKRGRQRGLIEVKRCDALATELAADVALANIDLASVERSRRVSTPRSSSPPATSIPAGRGDRLRASRAPHRRRRAADLFERQ
jgi:hypothetical protein